MTSIEASLLVGDEPVPAPSGNGTIVSYEIDHDDTLRYITDQLEDLLDHPLDHAEDNDPLQDITERLEDLLDHLLDHPEDDDTLQDTTDWLESQLDRLLDHADDIWEHQ